MIAKMLFRYNEKNFSLDFNVEFFFISPEQKLLVQFHNNRAIFLEFHLIIQFFPIHRKTHNDFMFQFKSNYGAFWGKFV